MKKVKILISILLCVIMCFCLSACKSQNAITVDEKIMAMDESNITLESATEISEVQSLFDALSEEEKQTIENKGKLDSIVEKYSSLEAAEVAKVQGKIDAIPTTDKITLSSKDIINDAIDSYNSTTDAVKSKINNAENLTVAKEQVEQIEAAEIEKKINAIPSLGSMTLSSKKTVEAAEDAYDSASSSVRAKVKNKDKLDDSKDKLEELREATWRDCSKCGGTGRQRCINCKGSGLVRYYAGMYDEGTVGPCTMCDEKGSYTCETCNGAGGRYRD